jgi:hypothetical protein
MSQVLHIKDLYSRLVLLGVGGNFKRWDLVEGVLALLRGLWGFILFFFFSFIPVYKVSSFTLPMCSLQ